MKDFFEMMDNKGIKYTIEDGKVVVGGNLYLSGTDIVSLPNGLRVDGNLGLKETAITSLPDRLIVGGFLDLEGTAITSLPDDLTVGGLVDLVGTPITSLPNGLTIGGNLYLNGTPITSLPNGLTIGGNLYLNGTNITSLPGGLTVGGGLYLNGTNITSLPGGLTVGGGLYLNDTNITSLPDGLTVGGSLYLTGTAITSLPSGLTVGGNLYLSGTPIEHLDVTHQNKNLLSWQDGKYIKVDGIFTEVVQRKGNVWRVKRLGCDEVSYLVTDGNGKYAHGDTLDEARESLVFKLSKRSVEDYKHLTLESVLTFAEAVSCYRVITGACEFGVRQFIKDNNIKKQDYTVQQMLELTTDAYGGSKFSKFFK